MLVLRGVRLLGGAAVLRTHVFNSTPILIRESEFHKSYVSVGNSGLAFPCSWDDASGLDTVRLYWTLGCSLQGCLGVGSSSMQVFLVMNAASYLSLPATTCKIADIVVVLVVAIVLFSEDHYGPLFSHSYQSSATSLRATHLEGVYGTLQQLLFTISQVEKRMGHAAVLSLRTTST